MIATAPSLPCTPQRAPTRDNTRIMSLQSVHRCEMGRLNGSYLTQPRRTQFANLQTVMWRSLLTLTCRSLLGHRTTQPRKLGAARSRQQQPQMPCNTLYRSDARLSQLRGFHHAHQCPSWDQHGRTRNAHLMSRTHLFACGAGYRQRTVVWTRPPDRDSNSSAPATAQLRCSTQIISLKATICCSPSRI